MQPVSHSTSTFADLLALEGVVEELQIRGPIGFCAFHGGNLERVTDTIASRAAELADASYYAVTQPLGMRQHIPSAQIDPAQSESLASFIAHCDVVIAIHGYGRQGHWATLQLGGGNRTLATHIAHHLRWHLPAYRVVDELGAIPRELRGQHPKNPCNLSNGGGVQIELPPRVRGLSPFAHAWPGGHADDGVFSHTNDLVSGLASAALSWPRVR